MSAEKIDVELVTPEKLLFSDSAVQVVVPGMQGDFGVLPNHSPLISTLRPGVITIYKSDSDKRELFVLEGFAEVTNSRCTILAGEAIDLSEITLDEAKDRFEKIKSKKEHPKYADDDQSINKEYEFSKGLLEALES